jgi:acyl dehydratase
MTVPPASGEAPVWFEDFSVGQEFTSATRRLWPDDVLAYVRFSNDVRPVLDQPDRERLRVPDMYLFSLSVGLLLHGTPGYIPERFVAFFGFDTIAFESAAHTGDVMRSVARVTATTERGRNGVVTYEHEARDGDGRRLVTSTHRILVERRDGHE